MIQFSQIWIQTKYESKEGLRFLHIFCYILEPNKEIWKCVFFKSRNVATRDQTHTHTHTFLDIWKFLLARFAKFSHSKFIRMILNC